MKNRFIFFTKVGLSLSLLGIFPALTQSYIYGEESPSTAMVASVVQQSKEISGIIVDSKGETIIGANIKVKGTAKGTVSDMDGKFSLSDVPSSGSLIISFVGYKEKEVLINGQVVYKIVLTEDARTMDEVVVVGYGSVKKSDLTSSVTSVKAEDMAVSATPSIGTALQGVAPGVEVTTNSASPGGAVDIKIRGIGTMNDNSPLFVVDGVAVNSIEFINNSDIERMEILKDATSAAIYGSRGSNGVILITTKSGKNGNGKYTINFNGSFGIQSLGHKMKMADATEFANIYNESRENSNVSGRIDTNSLTGKGTDWINEVSRDQAPVQNYDFNVTGGTSKSSISAGLGYYSQKGVIKSSGYEKYSARLNTFLQANKVASFKFNMVAGYTSRDIMADEKDQYGGVLFDAMTIDPITTVMKPESEWVDNKYSNYSRSLYTQIGNPMGVIARTFDNAKQYSGLANIGLKLDFTKDLYFQTNIGVDYLDLKQKTFEPSFYINVNEKNDNNSITNYDISTLSYAWENTLNYRKTFKEVHKLTAMVGYTMEYHKSESITASATNTPGNDENLQYIQLATANQSNTGTISKNTLISYLGRLTYGFKDTYLLTANFRADGSSRFANGNKWGYFPSVSGAWIISNEGFFHPTDLLSFLKLRMGYGLIGNQNISDNAYVDQINNTYRYPFGETLSSGIATSIPGNANIKWETTEDYSIGLDGSLLNNKLVWTIDLYRRKTKNMLLDNPVPGYTGLYDDPTNLSAGIWSNVGSIRNQGLELSLEYRGQVSGLKFRIGGNASFVKNKILSFGDVSSISAGNIRVMGDITRSQVGSSIARFYGYKTNGIFKSDAEVQAYTKNGTVIQPNAHAGDLKYVDLSDDGKINDSDKTWIGSPLPKMTGGININLEYKGIDFRAYLYGTLGNKVVDANSVFYNSGKDVYNSLKGVYNAAWRESNPTATHPRLSSKDENGNFTNFSDYMVSDGSYLRLKDFQIGYNFQSGVISKLGMSKLRLYVAAQNLFTITSYKGLEPETSSTSASTLGIDYGNYPTSRSFLFGVNVSF